jgi:hypothetical protein
MSPTKIIAQPSQIEQELRTDLRELVDQYKHKVFFSRKDGDAAVASLSQGERDVLEQVAEVLGWRSLESLAVKYFPKFPNRKWWLEATRRVLKYSRSRNIVYFLLCLQSIEREALTLAFSGKQALNRLVYKANSKVVRSTNRLESMNESKTFRGRVGPLQRVVLARMGGLMG